MSLTRGPPRSFFFGCIPPLLRPSFPLPISVLSRIPRTGYVCIGTRIRIVRTGPPPATTIFHSNRRIEKYWWLGRFYRVICQTTMDLVPPCRSDTAGDLTLRAEKCVKLPFSSNHLRPEKREISYARYYTSYNAKIYVILVVGDIVTCQKWMDKVPP